MNDDIIVLDNFLPLYVQDHIENLCYKVPWVMSKQTQNVDNFILGNYRDKGQFTHLFWHVGENKKSLNNYEEYLKLSHYFSLPLQIACLKQGISFGLETNLYRGKVNLTHNDNNPSPISNLPHRDIIGVTNELLKSMWAIIYYVNESDGDTIIYNEKEQFNDLSKYTIRQSISPKKGRIVFIKGDLFHSASTPSSEYSKRIVINYNLIF